MIYDITGPAYRVTIPGVVMIAMLRKEYEQRKFKLQNRLKKLVEIGFIIFIIIIMIFLF